MNIDKINGILKGFAQNTIGFQGAALVDLQGQPITSIGLDENATLNMAGSMFYLIERTRNDFGWQGFEQIDVQGAEGYVILAACSLDVFLLAKATKVPKGMLLADLNRTVEKLKAALKDEDSDSQDSNNREPQNTESTQPPISNTQTTEQNSQLPHPQMYRGSVIPPHIISKDTLKHRI